MIHECMQHLLMMSCGQMEGLECGSTFDLTPSQSKRTVNKKAKQASHRSVQYMNVSLQSLNYFYEKMGGRSASHCVQYQFYMSQSESKSPFDMVDVSKTPVPYRFSPI
jgi:hypothetical protein